MHIMSFEEFLENGKPQMSVIIQRVADRYKKNYKYTLKRRKCSVCGRNLPFGYPYSMCQSCHDEMTWKRKYFGNGYYS